MVATVTLIIVTVKFTGIGETTVAGGTIVANAKSGIADSTIDVIIVERTIILLSTVTKRKGGNRGMVKITIGRLKQVRLNQNVINKCQY